MAEKERESERKNQRMKILYEIFPADVKKKGFETENRKENAGSRRRKREKEKKKKFKTRRQMFVHWNHGTG